MIALAKGNRINLTKAHPGLNRVRFGLGWTANASDGSAFDLDASAFICKHDAEGNPCLMSDAHFIFFNQKVSPCGAILHSGDNRTGVGDGDDEVIIVDLAKLPAEAAEVSFVVTVHEAAVRRQNFGQVRSSYVKLYNDETGEELAKYSLEDDFSDETALQFGSLYKADGEWRFKAVGAGYKKGIEAFIDIYSKV
jgi:tellurium resistance protein TerD